MYHRISPFGYGALSQWPVLCDLAIICVYEGIYTRCGFIMTVWKNQTASDWRSRPLSFLVFDTVVFIRWLCVFWRILYAMCARLRCNDSKRSITGKQLIKCIIMWICQWPPVLYDLESLYYSLFNHDGLKQSIVNTLIDLSQTDNWNGDKREKKRGTNMRKKNLRVVHKQVYDRVQIQQVHDGLTNHVVS